MYPLPIKSSTLLSVRCWIGKEKLQSQRDGATIPLRWWCRGWESLPAPSQTESSPPATKAIVFKIRLMMEPCCFLKLVKGPALGSSSGREAPAGNEEEADSSSEAASFIRAQRKSLSSHGSELSTHIEHALFASIIDFLCVVGQYCISSRGMVSGGILKVYRASETRVTFTLTCGSSSPISEGTTLTSQFSCIN